MGTFRSNLFMYEDACFLFRLGHCSASPRGSCPRCQAQDRFAIHRYVREPGLDSLADGVRTVFTRGPGQRVPRELITAPSTC